MIIYPAMDLINGACVRLLKGDFEAITVYERDPFKQAQSFKTDGASWLHIVDLDGAKNGAPEQTQLIAEIAKATGLKVQSGGGLRTLADAENMLTAGIDRVVIGSLSVKNPEAIETLLNRWGAERITIALDVMMQDGEAFIATHGWQKTSKLSLSDALNSFNAMGAKHILVTDISRDGLLTGPNVALYREIQTRFNEMDIQVSGGMSSLDDLQAIRSFNARGVIIGKALYEKKFTLDEALALVGARAC